LNLPYGAEPMCNEAVGVVQAFAVLRWGKIWYLHWVAWRTLGLLDGTPRALDNKPTPLMALWDTGMPGSTMGTPGSRMGMPGCTPRMLGSAGHHIPIYTKSIGLHAASHYQWRLND
jgi:hypothetical protein